MKSKSTSSFERNFIFNACMNQSGIMNNNSKLDPAFNLKNKKKINSSKTLGKPVSMNDLHLNKKGKSIKKPELCSPFQQILQEQKYENKPNNPSLTNSSHNVQNQSLRYENLVQSQHSRKSRYEGNKIKIFSNDNSKGSINIQEDRGKSVSRDSYGTSTSRQKRGIQVTKTLLKKISGMYSDQDFGRNSQPVSSRSSQYQKSAKKLQQDSFHNQTGFMMTTWDSQRTTEEYQLSREYDSVNNRPGTQNFGLASYGTINTLNNSYESNRVLKDFSRQNISYANNQIADYSMRQQNQRYSSNSISQPKIMAQQQQNFPSSNSIKQVQNPILVKQKGVPLPLEYQQRPSYHQTIKPTQQKKKDPGSSISKGKLFTKTSQSKIFSPSPNLPSTSHPTPQFHPSPQKNSLYFSKSKQLPILRTTPHQPRSPLFQTAHEILSEQASSLSQPFHRNVTGEQLTNLLYGNKDGNHQRGSKVDQSDKDKYLVRYKNKTFEDLSVKQSMVEGFDHYYQ